MADVIQVRRGTAAEWRAADPVLRAGEPGFETDTGLQKMGDGAHRWSQLPYVFHERALEKWHARVVPYDQGTGGAVVNVRAEKYGATGDGTTDDTAAVQAAIDDTPDGGVCWFPPGTYLLGSTARSILGGRSGIILAGAGPTLSVLRAADDTVDGARILDLSGRRDVQVRDLGFVGASHGRTGSGVYASTAHTQKNLVVEHCRLERFMPGAAVTTYAAVYVWTADGVGIVANEFVGCGRAVTVDHAAGHVTVSRNRITADPGVMATGVWVRSASGSVTTKVVVDGNYVRGAGNDPSGNGAEGHGIAVYRSRDVHVTHNHCEAGGRGILVSHQSFGAIVQGNTCTGNRDAGIRCEPEIGSTTTTVGQDAPRGVTVIGNVCHDNRAVGEVSGANSGIGITVSYAAGSVVAGNLCHDNSGDGIHCDSDRVTILGNVCFNNFRDYPGEPTNGRRAGIRLYAGVGCTVVGNQCFDNQSTPTQSYGLSLSGSGTAHVVHGNNFLGNGVGEIYGAPGRIREGFFGASPAARPADPGTATGPDAAVINNLVDGLRQLGLFG